MTDLATRPDALDGRPPILLDPEVVDQAAAAGAVLDGLMVDAGAFVEQVPASGITVVEAPPAAD